MLWLTQYLNGGAIVTLVGALISAFATAWKEQTQVKLTRRVAIGRKTVAVAGIVVAALGAIISSIQQSRSAAESKAQSAEILRLTQGTLYTVNGGDSYCIVKPQIVIGENGSASAVNLTLYQFGHLPAYDVEVLITDETLREQLLQQNPRAEESIETSSKVNAQTIQDIRFATVGVGEAEALPTLSLAKMPQRFRISVHGRNYSYTELLIRAVRRDSKVLIATRRAIRPFDGEPTITEWADPDFPRNSNGQIDWQE